MLILIPYLISLCDAFLGVALETALAVACSSGEEGLVQKLLKLGARVDLSATGKPHFDIGDIC